jgi:hypothetical protein
MPTAPAPTKLERAKNACRKLRRSVVDRFGADNVSILDDERVAFKRTWTSKSGSGVVSFSCSVHPQGKIRIQFTKNLIPMENVLELCYADDGTPAIILGIHPTVHFKVKNPLDTATMHGYWDMVDGSDPFHTVDNAELMLHALCAF